MLEQIKLDLLANKEKKEKIKAMIDPFSLYDEAKKQMNVQTYLRSDGAVVVIARPVPVNAINFTFNYISV